VNGKHIYEIDVDVITKIVRWYFLTGRDFLGEEEEKVLIAKVLQRNTWKVVSERLNVEKVYEIIRNSVERILERQ